MSQWFIIEGDAPPKLITRQKQRAIDTDTNEHVWGPSAGSDANINLHYYSYVLSLSN